MVATACAVAAAIGSATAAAGSTIMDSDTLAEAKLSKIVSIWGTLPSNVDGDVRIDGRGSSPSVSSLPPWALVLTHSGDS